MTAGLLALIMGLQPASDLISERAERSLGLIENRFWDAPAKRYRLYARGDSPIAFLWDTGVVLSAYSFGLRTDRVRFRPLLNRWLAAHEAYWNTSPPVPGYSATPSSKPDRYYDDNAWVALALAEAYGADPRPEILEHCRKVLAFVLSGLDDEMGGGVFWHEDKRTKNTCSNGNTAATCFILARLTGDSELQQRGEAILKWLERLRDSDGLFWDNIDRQGKIEKTKWSYNSALPLRAYLERFKLTKDQNSLKQAVWIARSAKRYWMVEGGAIRCDSAFAHLLAIAWLELDAFEPRGHWRDLALQAMDYAWHNTANSEGLFGRRWEAPDLAHERQLLPTASMAAAYWRAKANP